MRTREVSTFLRRLDQGSATARDLLIDAKFKFPEVLGLLLYARGDRTLALSTEDVPRSKRRSLRPHHPHTTLFARLHSEFEALAGFDRRARRAFCVFAIRHDTGLSQPDSAEALSSHCREGRGKRCGCLSRLNEIRAQDPETHRVNRPSARSFDRAVVSTVRRFCDVHGIDSETDTTISSFRSSKTIDSAGGSCH